MRLNSSLMAAFLLSACGPMSKSDATGSTSTARSWVDGTACSFGQGAWGQDCSGSNFGCIRDSWFSTVYPDGLLIDGAEIEVQYDAADEIAAALPAGGPFNENTDSSFFGQLLTLRLNLDHSEAGVFGEDSDLASATLTRGDYDGLTAEELYEAAIRVDVEGPSVDETIAALTEAMAAFNDGFGDCDVELGPAGIDEDGDGVASDEDCNDSDSAVYPGADEVCDDGKDNDCDGLSDCEDGTCASGCAETICDDGQDNDGDGLTDCDDDECLDSCIYVTLQSGPMDIYRKDVTFGDGGWSSARADFEDVTGTMVGPEGTCQWTVDSGYMWSRKVDGEESADFTTSVVRNGLTMDEGCEWAEDRLGELAFRPFPSLGKVWHGSIASSRFSYSYYTWVNRHFQREGTWYSGSITRSSTWSVNSQRYYTSVTVSPISNSFWLTP